MNNTKLNFLLSTKINNLIVSFHRYTICILLLFTFNSLAQPPLDITKEKEAKAVKQPPITQPQQPVKETKSQLATPKSTTTPVKIPVAVQPSQQSLPQGVKEITIFPFEDNTKIEFQYKGSIELESLGDTAIVGIQLLPNTEYKLQVRIEKYIHPKYGVEVERFVLYKQIKPAPVIVNNIPVNNPVNNGKELYVYELPNGKVIQTNNTIVFIDQWIEDDGSISIKLLGENNYRRFYNNIYRFTFYEGATYILEVIKEGSDYILINVLSETPTSVNKPAIKQYPTVPPHIINRILTEDKIKDSKITAEPVYEVQETTDATTTNYYPVFSATSLDSAIWHLRYLFEADGITPHNFTKEDIDLYFSITFDKFFNKAKGTTPCTTFEAKLLTDNSDKFDCYNLIAPERRCAISALQQVFFNQLQTVNKYEIVDNKLRLLKDSKVLLLFEGFAIK